MSQLFQEEDDRNDLDEVLSNNVVTPQEKTKVARLLPSEVWQGRCLKCGKLAVRLFPPRKGLDLIEKKGGIFEVMKGQLIGSIFVILAVIILTLEMYEGKLLVDERGGLG